ncbi:MAG: hypothetical protein PHF84_10530 [bacterium]|nr:hypothetical protein [bacterium]
MKKIFLLLLLLIRLDLWAGIQTWKEKNIVLCYEKEVNPFTVEYIMNLAKIIDQNFRQNQKYSGDAPLNIYIYESTANFMRERSSMWWQNFIIRSNVIYLNNVNLMLEKNFLQTLMKYLIYRVQFSTLYGDKVPEWVMTGIAVYYTDKNLFPPHNIKFSNFQEIIDRIHGYKTTEELDQINHYYYRAVKYIFDNYKEDPFFQIMGQSNNFDEWQQNFFNLTGITYNEFIQNLLIHLN